jgi:ParB family transcriptional regulator, chromosome partitioning protein
VNTDVFSASNAVDVELGQLDLRYASLRIRQRERVSRLAAVIGQSGQQTPLLVAREGPHWVLVDGFAQVEALRRVGEDIGQALVIAAKASDGLVLAYRLDQGHRHTALEEGWLLEALVTETHASLAEIAAKLDRSASWGSRRLGLVRQLPLGVQDLVREGKLGAHAAMRVLLPLARANAEAAQQLAAVAARERFSCRQLGALVTAWRAATSEQRSKILAHPELFLRTAEHVAATAAAVHEPQAPAVRELQTIEDLARRAARLLSPSCAQTEVVSALLVVWPRTRAAVGALTAAVEAIVDARL